MKFAELSALYHQPLFDLISQSRAVHLQHWRGEEIQRCTLLSIKTGGCSEDCAYCAQSAHYSTGLEREELLSLQSVLAAAGARVRKARRVFAWAPPGVASPTVRKNLSAFWTLCAK